MALALRGWPSTNDDDGALVWIQWGANVLWPARACSESEVPDGVMQAKRDQSQRLFFTFGDHKYMWVNADNVLPYSAASTPVKPRPKLAAAVEEAKLEHLRREGLWECWACTLVNPKTELKCGACHAKRRILKEPAAKRPATSESDEKSSPESDGNQKKQRQIPYAYPEGARVAVNFDGEPYLGLVKGHRGGTARGMPLYDVLFDDGERHEDICEDEIELLSVDHEAAGAASSVTQPPVRRLRGAELCCGSARLAKAAIRRGFDMVTLDRNAQALEYDEDLLPRDSAAVWTKELRELRPEDMPTVDYFHCSPDCRSTSLMAASVHLRVQSNDFQGNTAACEGWNADGMHFYRLVTDQRSRPGNMHCAFTFEQPAGMARRTHMAKLLEQPVSSGGLGAVRITIDMCRHGLDCQKPTDLWVSGLPSLVDALAEPCPDGGSCHCRCPDPCGVHRISKWRCSRLSPCKHFPSHSPVRGNTKHAWASAFPHELCAFIMAYVERDLCAQRVKG